uniref:Uncharacterized protein n=1 Tax=Panagrolaimus sp. PS1159 TaxID=55785 RepID=A0AC35F8S0_9BILA
MVNHKYFQIFIFSTSNDHPITAKSEYKPAESPPRYMKLLYSSLFKDYQHELRPVANESEPLKVSMQFWLKQILKLNERDQTVLVYCWLELYWKDEFLSWNPSDFGGIDRIHVPASKLWKPDILVYNNANMNVKENELETYAILSHTGDLTLFRSIITDITCEFSHRLRDFPFDKQVCFLTFASWSFDGSKIRLLPVNGTDNLELYIHNTEWQLIGFAYKVYEKMYDCCPNAPFIDITYFFALKRSPTYYIFSLVIPSGFITVVTIVGFFTPHSTTGENTEKIIIKIFRPHSTTGENTEKVSLGVTAVMTVALIMLMVSDHVPATAEVVPLIAKYYIGLIFIVFLAALTTTFTLSYQMRGNLGTRMSPKVRYFLFETIAKNRFLSWIFAIQITSKKHLTRLRKFENNSYIFENTGAIKDGNSNNSVCKVTVSQTAERKAKLVQMEDITGEFQRIATDCENPGCSQFAFKRLCECIETIEQSICQEQEYKLIQFEWEQGTRIIERLIMIFYILVTLFFGIYMLTGRDDDVKLTDELMDKIKF